VTLYTEHMRLVGALLVAILACGCDLVFTVHIPEGPFVKRITVLSDPAPLANFPVSVAFPSDADLAAHADPTGTDIGFIDLQGNPLGYEIVQYDAATGALDAWVRVPELVGGTQLYLTYGGGVIAPTGPAWPEELVAVWHLSSKDNIAHDSTESRHDLSPDAKTMVATMPGVAGAAFSYDGVDDKLCAPADLKLGTLSFSYSLWVNDPTGVAAFDEPLYKGGASFSQPGFDFELGRLEWTANVADGANRAQTVLSPVEVLNKWTQLVAVVDREATKLRGYIDAVASNVTGDVGAIGSVDGSEPLCIGGPLPFHGLIDEVRIYIGVLEPQWIAAEHRNLADRDHFLVIDREMERRF
jgi:concanavalin A-like lectin/glucanase superfamily protein